MKKRWFIFMCPLVALLLFSCVPKQHPTVHTLMDKTHQTVYTVTGRVMDTFQNPVENCKVVLIKQRVKRPWEQGFPISERPKIPNVPYTRNVPEIVSEGIVAFTDTTGDYIFSFEPLEANEFWLYFEAEEEGLAPRFVDITEKMGATVFEDGGNSPFFVSVVMERKTNLNTLNNQ